MIDAMPSLEAAEGLKGTDLLPYLAANGWAVRPSRVEGVSILSKQLPDAEGSAELILPVRPGFVDEHRRVADALRTLAQIEGQPEALVAENVRRAAHSTPSPEVEVPPKWVSLAYAEWPSMPQLAGFLSDVEIEGAANQLRKNLGVSDDPAFNIVYVLEREMPRIIADFRFEVMTDPQSETYSRMFPPRIFIRSDIRNRALHGEPRSRFMIAHELAHLLLQADSPKRWRGGSLPEIRMRVRAEEAEASKFAAALLMPSAVVSQIRDPLQLSLRCNVSLEAAKFRIALLYHVRETTLSGRAYRFLRRALSHALRKLD